MKLYVEVIGWLLVCRMFIAGIAKALGQLGATALLGLAIRFHSSHSMIDTQSYESLLAILNH